MVTSKDIYVAFRKAQAKSNNRGWKMPKDFDAWLKKHPKEAEALDYASGLFNTKWRNLDLTRFMDYGFELWKGKFTYNRFFNKNLVKFYIDKDKMHKRNIDLDKRKIIQSAKFIKEYCLDKDLSFIEYCKLKDGYRSKVIEHYLKGKIDKYVVTYMMYKRYLIIEEGERNDIPNINQVYRTLIEKVLEIKPFLEEMEKKI